MRYESDLALALRLARIASDVVLPFVGTAFTHELKSDGSPVSEVDLAIEAVLIETLAEERPLDAVLSEERGSIGEARRRWLLDPLDGTSMFVAGETGWGTLITLQEDEESRVAVVTRPQDDLCWWAVKGGGAFVGSLSAGPAAGSRVTLSSRDALDDARVTAWGDLSSPEIDVLARLAGWLEPGASSFPRLMSGKLDGIVSLGGLVWDHAPTVLIVEEAGGAFRDRRGGARLDLLGGVYAVPGLVEPLGALLGWFESSS